jgi:hypothetical protein
VFDPACLTFGDADIALIPDHARSCCRAGQGRGRWRPEQPPWAISPKAVNSLPLSAA